MAIDGIGRKKIKHEAQNRQDARPEDTRKVAFYPTSSCMDNPMYARMREDMKQKLCRQKACACVQTIFCPTSCYSYTLSPIRLRSPISVCRPASVLVEGRPLEENHLLFRHWAR